MLAVLVSVVVLAFSWPSVTSEAHDLPIAIAGDAAAVGQVESGLDAKAPDTFVITEVDDRRAAVDLIETRQVYGAIIVGAKPEVLTASAASPVVSQALTALAAQLQASVTDVVPLAKADPRGAGLASAVFPLVIGGMIGGVAITFAIVGAWRRLVALAVYAIAAGLAIAGILEGWFGVLQGGFLVDAGVITLALLAIGAPIVGLAALVGRPGIAIGPVLFLLIGNPIASVAAPLEFLPQPWGDVGQWFPPGAGATLLRDVSYFPKADLAFPTLVLSVWAAVGILLGLIGHFRQTGGATHEALVEAEERA